VNLRLNVEGAVEKVSRVGAIPRVGERSVGEGMRQFGVGGRSGASSWRLHGRVPGVGL
jgi:hypothetical protein